MARCKNMLNGFVIVLLSMMLLSSCHTQRQTIVETKTETRYVDSVRYTDSVVMIPVEKYANLAYSFDTLTLSTSLAEASCWVDSIWLRGEIHNKQGVQYKYITKTEYITRDSISYVEKPVPYEVEVVKTKNAAWWVWLWAILASCVIVCAIWLKARSRNCLRSISC